MKSRQAEAALSELSKRADKQQIESLLSARRMATIVIWRFMRVPELNRLGRDAAADVFAVGRTAWLQVEWLEVLR